VRRCEMNMRQRMGLVALLLAILIVAGNGGVANMTIPELVRMVVYVLGGIAMLLWPERGEDA